MFMLHREKHRQKTGGLWRIFRARYKKGSDQLRKNGQHLPEDAGLLAAIRDAKLIIFMQHSENCRPKTGGLWKIIVR